MRFIHKVVTKFITTTKLILYNMPIIYCKKVKVKGQNYLYRLLFQKKKKKERKKERKRKRKEEEALSRLREPLRFFILYIYIYK